MSFKMLSIWKNLIFTFSPTTIIKLRVIIKYYIPSKNVADLRYFYYKIKCIHKYVRM